MSPTNLDLTVRELIPLKYRDLAARAFWTAAQSAVALVTVDSLGVPAVYAVPVAWALSAVKSFIAGKVGFDDTVTFRD